MRALWVLLMLCGVIGFAGFTVLAMTGIPIGDGLVIRSRGVWPIVSLLVAGACAAGIFMKPREFKAAIQQDEPEVKRAAWLDQLNKPPET